MKSENDSVPVLLSPGIAYVWDSEENQWVEVGFNIRRSQRIVSSRLARRPTLAADRRRHDGLGKAKVEA